MDIMADTLAMMAIIDTADTTDIPTMMAIIDTTEAIRTLTVRYETRRKRER